MGAGTFSRRMAPCLTSNFWMHSLMHFSFEILVLSVVFTQFGPKKKSGESAAFRRLNLAARESRHRRGSAATTIRLSAKVAMQSHPVWFSDIFIYNSRLALEGKNPR